MAIDSTRKRISDVIHGPIGLSDLELALIQSSSFQRLRGIKQLGLAHYVYPSADYARFAHSLGVCHVTGEILNNLRRSGVRIDDEEIQLYRLAALFHDVGHYPFSHATEFAVKNFYSAGLFAPADRQTKMNFEPPIDEVALPERYFMHERLGKEVLAQDGIIAGILRRSGIEPAQISAIFLRERPPRFSNLVSSDLDADRIDYLLRTAHHTGLPYGRVDIGYLLSQMRIDSQDRLCLSAKALQTAEHLLISRYFDYRRSNYHKTVAALELVLKDVVGELLRAGLLDCTAQRMSAMIRGGEWAQLDDAHIMRLIADLYSQLGNGVVKQKIESILYRRPPSLICDMEYFGRRGDANFRLQVKTVKAILPKLAREFSIDASLLYVWDQPGMPLTKVGSSVPLSTAYDDKEELEPDRYQQLIRILDHDQQGSTPIVELRHSIMSVLSDQAWYAIRLYALLPRDSVGERERMRDYVLKQTEEIPWK